jgi:hypothetical protein
MQAIDRPMFFGPVVFLIAAGMKLNTNKSMGYVGLYSEAHIP